MTEFEWLSCRDPQKMLLFLGSNGRASERKKRLFAAACCRPIWHLLTDIRSRRAVDLVERAAEGGVRAKRLADARDRARRAEDAARSNPNGSGAQWSAAMSAVRAIEDEVGLAAINAANALASATDPTQSAPYDVAKEGGMGFQAELLRCIFANPFRAVPVIERTALVWNDGTVRRLAQAAYEDRSLPDSTLDRARLAVLADALEEAGCTDTLLLEHLRGPGLHVRGCFALDAILDKS